jgi:hypothetical protein
MSVRAPLTVSQYGPSLFLVCSLDTTLRIGYLYRVGAATLAWLVVLNCQSCSRSAPVGATKPGFLLARHRCATQRHNSQLSLRKYGPQSQDSPDCSMRRSASEWWRSGGRGMAATQAHLDKALSLSYTFLEVEGGSPLLLGEPPLRSHYSHRSPCHTHPFGRSAALQHLSPPEPDGPVGTSNGSATEGSIPVR